MISIIVPAHNEEPVISRGLRAMVTGARPGELEVIVACNGCTDRTAEIAREFGPPVTVIEVPTASKIAALNAGDAAATGYPRFYVDADVVLDLASIRKMARALEGGNILFATPTLEMNMAESSWAVRAFYRVWTQLPYNQTGGQVGTGVYALSREGRGRFGSFPQVINDDGFVRFLFAPTERAANEGAVSRVDAPKTVGSLVRAKTRVRVGHAQLKQEHSRRLACDREAVEALWKWTLRRPDLWLALPIYAAITLAVRRRAGQQVGRQALDWGRDDSRGAGPEAVSAI